MKEPPVRERTFTEELEMAGRDVVRSVERLIEEGNVRRIIVRRPSGEMLLDIPLTAGVVVGGATALLAPTLAALAAIAAVVSRVRVEVVRSLGD